MIAAKVVNKRLSDEEFFRIRNEEVLPQWETGKANLEMVVEDLQSFSTLPHAGVIRSTH